MASAATVTTSSSASASFPSSHHQPDTVASANLGHSHNPPTLFNHPHPHPHPNPHRASSSFSGAKSTTNSGPGGPSTSTTNATVNSAAVTSTTLPGAPLLHHFQSQVAPAATPLSQALSAALFEASANPAVGGGNFHHPQMQPSLQQSQPGSQQSFTMSQPSSQPQTSLAASSFRHFSDPNPRMNDAALPQIYSAVYSGVDVYEMEVNDVAVMRRRNDSWLNATQILKVAGVDKGKRTKILEKEIQTGEHEKVQGGYGKYQGTWIKFEKAVEVCKQYGVEDILRPLLTYDMGQDGGIAGRGDFNTPTKEQAMAAQRKRLYTATSDNRNANGGMGTFFKNISSTATNAVAAISKARFDSPAPRNRTGPTRAPSFNRQPSMQSLHGADGTDDFRGGNSQGSNFTENFPPPDANTAFSAGSGPQPMNGDGPDQPPRKRQRLNITPANSFGPYPNNSQMQSYADAFPGSPTEPNDSFIYTQHAAAAAASMATDQNAQHDGVTPLAPLPFEVSTDAASKRSMLMSLFMDEGTTATTEQSRQDVLRSMVARDLDMPIDAQSHTALHWAATLGRMPLLRGLLACGANPFRVNSSGETALMRACIVTNSHDHNTMPELLDALGATIEVQDNKGRTVLHHIALTSAVKGRSAASRYYLQCLLEWVVRQGATATATAAQGTTNGAVSSSQGSQQPPPGSSQNTALNGNGAIISSSQSQPLQNNNPPAARLGLARFMSEMLNAQDSAGDTALNIAARIGTRSIISQLLEVCASPHIANNAGLRPLDFGIGVDDESGGGGQNGSSSGGGGGGNPNSGGGGFSNGENGGDAPRREGMGGVVLNSQRSRESSDDIVTSITHLLSETASNFTTEMKTKQQDIDTLHTSLRAVTAQITEARRKVDSLQALVKQQQRSRQKIANLSRAREQEDYRAMQLRQSSHGRSMMSPAAGSNLGGWVAESQGLLAAITATSTAAAAAAAAATTPTTADGGREGGGGESAPQPQMQPQLLPSAALLRARANAIRARTDDTRQAVGSLKSRSREVEGKYRRLVRLATRCAEGEVDECLDSLMRAVDSEQGEPELGRIRRFLVGVEGVAV